MDGVYIDP